MFVFVWAQPFISFQVQQCMLLNLHTNKYDTAYSITKKNIFFFYYNKFFLRGRTFSLEKNNIFRLFNIKLKLISTNHWTDNNSQTATWQQFQNFLCVYQRQKFQSNRLRENKLISEWHFSYNLKDFWGLFSWKINVLTWQKKIQSVEQRFNVFTIKINLCSSAILYISNLPHLLYNMLCICTKTRKSITYWNILRAKIKFKTNHGRKCIVITITCIYIYTYMWCRKYA